MKIVSPGKSRPGIKNTFIGIFVIVFLAISCTPGTLVPTETQVSPTIPTPTLTSTSTSLPTQTVTPSPQPTPTTEFSPALVESSPLPGSDLGLLDTLTFYFNQPMLRDSVEKSWQSKPQIQGKFVWLDDASVKFVPDQPLPPTMLFNFSFATTAQAASGKPLTEPVELTYRSVDYLRISEQLPKPGTTDIDVFSAISVIFNQPVVSIPTSDGSVQNLPLAFTIDPPLKGRSEWRNASTFVFYPSSPLPGNTLLTIHLNTELSSTKSAPLAPNYLNQDKSWTFTSLYPSLVSVKPVQETLLPVDAGLVLTFNQPMDTASVEGNFSLTEAKGSGGAIMVGGSFTWNEIKSEVVFKPNSLLKRSTTYNLILLGIASSAGSKDTLKNNFATQFTTIPAPELVDSGSEIIDLTYNGYGSIKLRFNLPLANQNFLNFIGMNPDVSEFSATLSENNTVLTLSGFFKHGSVYYLLGSPDLADQWGLTFGKQLYKQFKTASTPVSLMVPSLQTDPPVLFVPLEDTKVPARLTNIKILEIGSTPISQEQFFQQAGMAASDRAANPLQTNENWEQEIAMVRDRHMAVEVALTRYRKKPPSGFYYYLMTSSEQRSQEKYSPSPFLVVMSNVNVVFKLSSKKALVWAVTIDKNKPVDGAPVVIFDNKGTPLGGCATDAQGMCTADLPFMPETGTSRNTFYAMIWKPGHASFGMGLSSWSKGISVENFLISGQNASAETIAYLYTDRPVYQNGQILYFRAVIRQSSPSGLTLPSLTQVTVKILGIPPTDGEAAPELAVLPLTLSTYGTVSGSYTLPADVPSGSYTLVIQDVPDAQISFLVAEVVPSTLDLTAQFTRENYAAGQDIEASVTAIFPNGIPASHMRVTWSLYASIVENIQLADGYQVGKQDLELIYSGDSGILKVKPTSIPLKSGSAEMDANGTLTLKIPSTDLLGQVDKDLTQRLTLVVSGQGSDGIEISASTSTQINPADFYIGIKSEAWGTPAGTELGFSIQTVNWQQEPAAIQKLTASFRKVLWKQVEVKDKLDSTWQIPMPEYVQVGSTDFGTDANGQARLVFTPLEPGTYQLEVRGSGTGGDSITQMMVWVGGEGGASWISLPDQHLTLVSDAQEYQPGQIARIFVPSPFKDITQALITVEQNGILQSKALFFSGSNYIFTLPILDEFAPVTYVSVTLLGRGVDDIADFRQGFIRLKVNSAKKTMVVKLTSQPVSDSPTHETRLTFQAKDSEGRPVKGEFSFAVIDGAALTYQSLIKTNSIQDAFYSSRPLGVLNSLSLTAYSRRLPGEPSPILSQTHTNPVLTLTQPLQDTAFWYGNIETDVNGMAEFNLTLPDDSPTGSSDKTTQWVVIVRGVDQAGLVGEAELRIHEPGKLVIKTLTPSYAITGDHIQVTAILENKDSMEMSAQVSLNHKGLLLDATSQAEQAVILPAGSQKRLIWWGTVQDDRQVSLVFNVKSGTLQEQVQSDFPVMRLYASWESWAGGILTTTGKQSALISLPRSFTPSGGDLMIEVAPSLTALLQGGLIKLESNLDTTQGYTINEAAISHLLAIINIKDALLSLNVDSAEMNVRLEQVAPAVFKHLMRSQNKDGGWGWYPGTPSDPHLSAYILYGLLRSGLSGKAIDAAVVNNVQTYLLENLAAPEGNTPGWQLDRLAFQYYVLTLSGRSDMAMETLFALRNQLSPWGTAFLAMTLDSQKTGNASAKTLLDGLQTIAKVSPSGSCWVDESMAAQNLGTTSFSTAAVTLALAQRDPTSKILPEALRCLLNQRKGSSSSTGPSVFGWGSSYETAWALTALAEIIKTSVDLPAIFDWSASLNSTVLLASEGSSIRSLNPFSYSLPWTDLKLTINELSLERAEGKGLLYYAASLRLSRPVVSTPPIQRGILLSRSFYPVGDGCTAGGCQSLSAFQLGSTSQLLEVRLTLSALGDLDDVLVEDIIPAGMAWVADNFSSVGVPGSAALFSVADPFQKGWGSWLFSKPWADGSRITWLAEKLPAGTYELIYRLVPQVAGEYQLLPAHAYQYYNPDVEGYTPGDTFTISPSVNP